MTIARVVVVTVLFAIASPARIGSQSPAQQPCGMPQLPPVSKEANLFSPEQARVLGDLIMNRVMRNYALVGDARLDAYLQAIADRMAETAGVGPVTVQLFDSPRVDGFTFPGGHVLVSRKLVAFVKNEDELAGMLAHEIGHVVSNDNERKMSAEWRDVLKVTSVGDTKDVEDKYNLWIENAARATARGEYAKRKETEEAQRAANQWAVWLLMRSGYSAQAYRDFWDRYRGRQGSTGSWLTDFLGITMPDPRRLPVSLETVAAMPGSCVGALVNSQAQFAAWQADVLNARRAAPAPSLSGVIAQRKLDPPLRPDITRLGFSPDGKWVLAQDPAGVYVFSRDPLALAVRIEAAAALPAQFTPDSTGVVFHDRNLRIERWSITTGRREWVREVVPDTGCIQTALSSDGTYLGCLAAGPKVRVYETRTGAVCYEKGIVFTVDGNGRRTDLANGSSGGAREWLQMHFSPDNRYFIAARDWACVSVDMTTRADLSLPRGLRAHLGVSFSFMGNDTIVGIKNDSPAEAAIVRFPGGQEIRQLTLGAQAVTAPTHGDAYVMLGGVKGAAVGIFSTTENGQIGSNRTLAFDIYDDFFLSEQKTGEVAVYRFGVDRPLDVVDVPAGPLGRLQAASVAPDLSTLAISGRMRGGVWDVTTGQLRVLTRGFRGAAFDASHRAYLDLPAEGREQRAIARVDPVSQAVEPLVGIDAPGLTTARAAPSLQAAQGRLAMGQTVIGTEIVQCGNYLVGWCPRQKAADPFTIAVHEAGTGRLLWSRTVVAQPAVMRAEPEHGTLALEWSVKSREGKAVVAADPDMKARVETAERAADKNRWRTASYVPASLSVFEFLNVATGAPIGRLLVDYGNGSFRLTSLTAAGEYVIAGDTENRTLVFSVATNREVARTVGTPLAVSGDGSLVLVQNAAGETAIYSVPELKKQQDLVFPSRVTYARFGEGGRVLFALTDNQTAYTIAVATQEPAKGGH